MTIESNLENAVIGSKTEIWLNVIDFLGKKKKRKAVKAKTPMHPAREGM